VKILHIHETGSGGGHDSAAITLTHPGATEYAFVFLDRDQVIAHVRELLATLDEPARAHAVDLATRDLEAFHDERVGSMLPHLAAMAAHTDAGPATGDQGAPSRSRP